MSSEEHSESAGASRSHRVGVIGGDGIGPEVTTEAFKVVDAALGSGVVTCDLLPYSAEHTINTGITIPEGSCRAPFGPFGAPWGTTGARASPGEDGRAE